MAGKSSGPVPPDGPPLPPKQGGDWGEREAAEYLRRRGCRILRMKYRCRYGEIDLIAQDGETLCFVEVKLRSNLSYGLPRESVTASKRRKLRAAASCYLASHDPDVPCRFDVAEVYTDAAYTPGNTRVVYLENAFE